MANGQLWYIDSNGVKHRLCGVVTGDLPSYTFEEYNALPVKPTYWIRLDGDDDPIASDQVSHGNGTVKSKLDSLDSSVSDVTTRMTTAEGDIDTLETNLSNTFRTATSNNLIPMPYKDAHGTRNGITYDQIDNAQPGDLPGYGSYKINGTASAYTELELTQTDIYLIPGTYRFLGGIGGSSSTYYLQIEVYNSRSVIDKFKNYSMFGQTWTTFTLSEKSRIKMKVIINSGVTVSNVPLFPILERYPQEILDEIDVDLQDLKVKKFFNVSSMTIDLGYTPDATRGATGILVNGNQGAFAFLRLDSTPSITKLAGNMTFSIAINGSQITITSSATLWGTTMIMYVSNK